MRLTILLILFLLHSVYGRSDCANSGIWVSSISKVTTTNSLFLIEGYAQSMDVIKKLNKDYPVYIESFNHKVRLEVIIYNKGDFNVSQAVLKPTEKLMKWVSYDIRIENLEDQHPKSYWGDNEVDFLTGGFYISDASVGYTKSCQLTDLSYKESFVNFYGCGPSVKANFNMTFSDTNYKYVEVDLAHTKTGRHTKYLVNYDMKNKQVVVGHGMCSGAFDYTKNGKYKVRFRIPKSTVDSPENEWSDWIIFDSPYKSIDANY